MKTFKGFLNSHGSMMDSVPDKPAASISGRKEAGPSGKLLIPIYHSSSLNLLVLGPLPIKYYLKYDSAN
jgi:hypothetical protein